MDQAGILYPVLALVGWTLVVLMMIPVRRFRAGKQKRIRMSDFEFGESADVPGDVSIPNRNDMNLPSGWQFNCNRSVTFGEFPRNAAGDLS